MFAQLRRDRVPLNALPLQVQHDFRLAEIRQTPAGIAPAELIVTEVQLYRRGEVAQFRRDRPTQLIVTEIQTISEVGEGCPTPAGSPRLAGFH